MAETDKEPSEEAAALESPLFKILSAVLGGGKKKQAAAAPQQTASRQTTAGAAPARVATTSAAPVSTKPMPPGPLMTVVMRNEFYRDGFRNMLRVAIAEAVIIVALILAFIVYMNSTKPQDHYFATTADGRIMQLVPLDRPNMGTAALMSWAAQSATEVMTFGFHDYQRRMQQASRNFTRRGWENFTDALQKSRIIESIETARQVVTAQPSSAPILVQEGVFNGKYRWVVDMPLTVTYQAGTATRNDNLAVRLVIDRVPSLENPNGVGIEQWIATQR